VFSVMGNTGWLPPCEHGGTCVNTPGSFRCACAAGYTGDRCETNIDECASNPCQNQGTCLDDRGRFTCLCMNGKLAAALYLTPVFQRFKAKPILILRSVACHIGITHRCLPPDRHR